MTTTTDGIAARYGSGQTLRRVEDPALLQGQGRFTDDHVLPGQLVLAFVRSSTAHSTCSGPGISPANRPTATPPAQLCRFRCHRRGWPSQSAKGASQGLRRRLAVSGMYLRRSFFIAADYRLCAAWQGVYQGCRGRNVRLMTNA